MDFLSFFKKLCREIGREIFQATQRRTGNSHYEKRLSKKLDMDNILDKLDILCINKE